MAEKEIKTRIINKHDTELNWNKAVNFIPKQGELIVYDIDDTHAVERFKIGDGITVAKDLSFTNNITSGIGKDSLQLDNGTAQANGEQSVALGGRRLDKPESSGKPNTIANGMQSFATGGSTLADGRFSFSSGKDTKAYQVASVAFGGANQSGLTFEKWLERHPGGNRKDYEAESSFAFTAGESNKALGRSSFVTGNSNVATVDAPNSFASGSGNSTDSAYTSIEGYQNNILKSSNASHAEGLGNIIENGVGAHAEGEGVFVGGKGAHGEGHGNGKVTDSNGKPIQGAIGNYSHVQGDGCLAEGQNSSATGSYTKIFNNGINATTMGNGTIAQYPNQLIVGTFNDWRKDQDRLFVVGNGTGNDISQRSNAFEISKTGDVVASGTIKAAEPVLDNDLTTKKYADNNYTSIKETKNLKSRVDYLEGITTKLVHDDSVAYEKKVPAKAYSKALLLSVGGSNALEEGKNLIDASKMTPLAYGRGGTPVYDASRKAFVYEGEKNISGILLQFPDDFFKSGKTYTVSIREPQDFVGWDFTIFDGGHTFSAPGSTSGDRYVSTFTVPAPGRYGGAFALQCSAPMGFNYTNHFWDQLQVEYGNEFTGYADYVPPKKVKVKPIAVGTNFETIMLPQSILDKFPANGVAPLFDTIDFEKKKIMVRIGMKTYNGSPEEGWTENQTPVGIWFKAVPPEDIDSSKKLLSASPYPVVDYYSDGEKPGVFVDKFDGLQTNQKAKDVFGSVAGWKKNLQENPINLVYALENPIEIDISAELAGISLPELTVQPGGFVRVMNAKQTALYSEIVYMVPINGGETV